MALSSNQKEFVNKNHKKLSAKKIAERLSVKLSDVEEYISEIPRKKTPFIFYILALAIPVIFFLFLELGLRITDYGEDYEQWVNVTDTKLMLNPDLAKRYFYNTENVPYSSKDVFDVDKKQNAIRIFVIGGSSAAGYPYAPNGSFAKYIRKRLEIMYPYNTIEVVNCAMSAINSYTLLDILPGILEHDPDGVLIYAGHNEYYGALGVGSMESIGNTRSLIKLNLALNKLRTFQLTRNVIRAFYGLFSEKAKRGGTLMARMAQEQSITLNSDTYHAGVEQFRANLDEILSILNENNIPVIVGNLTSNLKDQRPFISLPEEGLPKAKSVYDQAKEAYESGNYSIADSLFRYSKDLDALRFRAPEKFNEVIESLAKEYSAPLVNIDSLINNASPNGIVGDNLMVDHLHPNLKAYQMMGAQFLDVMTKTNMLPGRDRVTLPEAKADSIVVNNFDFTNFDSTLARYRIIILKTDWPYVDKAYTAAETMKLFNAKTYQDSLALLVIDDKMAWEEAHRKIADHLLEKGNIPGFIAHYNTVIDQFPIIYEYYQFAAEKLLAKKYYDAAYDFVKRRYDIEPDFFSCKWLGIIELDRGFNSKAITFLRKAIEFKSTDAQTWYNLSGAYLNSRKYDAALTSINQCLAINPQFRGASNLKKSIEYLITNQVTIE
ncbi:MAG: hypothetical protein SCALA702_21430 [Melioribacteraceae bacterium]|nr:MAG: hypothetical protein SCALA702_21430 [Melioribacteraceae bacterium]